METLKIGPKKFFIQKFQLAHEKPSFKVKLAKKMGILLSKIETI